MFGIVGSDEFNINANNSPVVLNVGIAMMSLSGSAVFLRYISRRLARQPWLWDDWMIVMAVLWAWAVCIVEFIAIHSAAYGRHIQLATPDEKVTFLKLLYVDQITYPLAIAFCKFSILLFYRRVFSVPSTKLPAYIIGAITMAWLIAMVLVGLFSCVPVNAFWEKSLYPSSRCISIPGYYLGVAVPNISTDVVLLIFPLPLIWRLRMAKSQKIAVTGIFAVAGLVVIISSLRLVTVIQVEDNVDVTWALVPIGIWDAVETNVGVILVCLPSMLPLLRLFLGQKMNKPSNRNINGGSLKITSRREFWRRYQKSRTDDANGFVRVDEVFAAADTGYMPPPTVQIRANHNNLELSGMRGPQQGIVVDSDIDWNSEHLGEP